MGKPLRCVICGRRIWGEAYISPAAAYCSSVCYLKTFHATCSGCGGIFDPGRGTAGCTTCAARLTPELMVASSCTCLRYMDETGATTGAPIPLSRCAVHPTEVAEAESA